jgi:hypothetical protein
MLKNIKSLESPFHRRYLCSENKRGLNTNLDKSRISIRKRDIKYYYNEENN